MNQTTWATRILAALFIGLTISLFAIGCKRDPVSVLSTNESFPIEDPTPVPYTTIEDTIALDPIPFENKIKLL